MNFITKNLGWILLLLFFIFMLFIISSNDPVREDVSNSGAVNSGSTSSGETDKNLDDLIKLIDNQEIVDSEAEIESQEENEEDSIEDTSTASGEVVENSQGENDTSEAVQEDEEKEADEKGFFARLFGRDNTNEENVTESGSQLEQENDEETDAENENTENETNQEVTTQTNESKSEIDAHANIMKSTNNNTQEYIEPEINYPGIDLVTSVGKSYEIGVEMLKLNNSSFTQTLALMSQGDVVTQLTGENSYGCFKVRVQSSGMLGYVCKKYLTETSQDVVTKDNLQSQVAPQQAKDNSDNVDVESNSRISSQVGSYYKIAIENTSFFDLVLERFTLQVGDVLRQTSLADPNTGCVEMKVVGTSNGIHDGKSVSICSPDMVTAM